ncbi:hypothetical protein ANOM_009951, partial [Aspergillus nomiae NRRL 13137]
LGITNCLILLFKQIKSSRELVYTDIPKNWGWEIVDHLNNTIERPSFSSFQSPYVGCRKEPDFFLRSDSIRMPEFVIETGWSESWSRLQHDMNLWLVGGAGDVGAVLLLKWKRIGDSNKARGKAELYALDRNGIPVMEDSKVLYSNPFTHSLLLHLIKHGSYSLCHLCPVAPRKISLSRDAFYWAQVARGHWTGTSTTSAG